MGLAALGAGHELPKCFVRHCDCDQSFEVHPPGYHAVDCLIWGPRYDLPDDYEFAFMSVR